MPPNPSIEGTSNIWLRQLLAAPHVKHWASENGERILSIQGTIPNYLTADIRRIEADAADRFRFDALRPDGPFPGDAFMYHSQTRRRHGFAHAEKAFRCRAAHWIARRVAHPVGPARTDHRARL